eukprot:TRINITY_DN24467_c0_g2_i1.p1 TRINITY_DN24467_c0_g2~~TRINITY_DN24467_c0_g2_i1.p1  ORF type:complete len:880 (+),score=116.87 TRINITY_DN24467_c0_g2_i1:102-2741(+)
MPQPVSKPSSHGSGFARSTSHGSGLGRSVSHGSLHKLPSYGSGFEDSPLKRNVTPSPRSFHALQRSTTPTPRSAAATTSFALGTGILSFGHQKSERRPSFQADLGGNALRASVAHRKQEEEDQRKAGQQGKASRLCSGWSWNSISMFESIALRDINFTELTADKYGPSVHYKDLSVSEQVELISDALKATKVVIDPDSSYMKGWDVVVMLSLVFTALVTPFEIAFMEPAYDLMYFFNKIVDLVFVKDMVMQFFLKIKKQTRQGTIWIRDRKKIARNYLSTWFVIDLLAILPYDEVSNQNVTEDINMDNLKVFRLIRVLRLFKLARILKASRVVKRWENRVSLKSTQLHLIRFTVLICLACHWMACVWGFFGLLNGTALTCRSSVGGDDPRLRAFPDQSFFIDDTSDINPYNHEAWSGTSWVVEFARGRSAASPVNPCDFGVVYIASVYWAVMTITSIGYGDILPHTTSEYLVCIFCMMASSILWSYIIGAACAVMTHMDPEQQQFDQRLDSFNAMAAEQDLPLSIRWRGREYLRENRFHRHYLRSLDALGELGTDLRGTVARQMASHYLDNIWFFQKTSAQFREETAIRFEPYFYERRELVNMPGHLSVVERGAVGRGGRILVPWSFWGEDMIVRLEALRLDTTALALTYSEIVCLSREQLTDVLTHYPEERKRFRQCAARMALMRMARLAAQEKAEGHPMGFALSIFDAARSGRGKAESKNTERKEVHDLIENLAKEDKCPDPLGEPKLSVENRLEMIQVQVEELAGRQHSNSSSAGQQQPKELLLKIMQQLSRVESRLDAMADTKHSFVQQAPANLPQNVDSTDSPASAVAEAGAANGTQVWSAQGPIQLPRGDRGDIHDGACCSVTQGRDRLQYRQ